MMQLNWAVNYYLKYLITFEYKNVKFVITWIN